MNTHAAQGQAVIAGALGLFIVGTTSCAGEDDPLPHIPQYDALHDVQTAPDAIRLASNAIVRIRIPQGYGTGSFISSDGLLLTNNHILGVDQCPREGCWFDLSFAWQRGSKPSEPVSVFGIPQHVDVGLDVAVIQVKIDPSGPNLPTPSFLALKSVDSAGLIGSPVYVVGHPEGHLKKWSTGDVAYADGNWMVSSAFALPGNSGSPFLDPQGRVVGILHRGPTAIDLVAAYSVADYSVGTSSASLIDLLGAPLPSTVRSLSDSLTAEDLLSVHAMYLAAHSSMANVEGKSTSVISVLAAKCDAELLAGAFRSYEDFNDRTAACREAAAWIDCGRNGAPAAWTTCPTGAEKAAWTARFEGVFAAHRALNGELSTALVTFDLAAMEASEADALVVVGARLARLAAETPPVDFVLAYSFAAFNVDSLEGRSIVDIIETYSRRPHYELEATFIVSAATWLAYYGRISPAQFDDLARGLAADDRVPLGTKLAVDDLRWQHGH